VKHEPSRERRSAVDLPGLWTRLRRDVEGEVRFDDGSLGLYSQDASNYFHVPLGVVIPKSRADVVATLAACRAFGAPVVSRAGGTALAGQTCNEAVVIDFSKYLNQIVALEPTSRRARVEPGVICDQLVDVAVPHGLTWGPQPATHDHCCFGGMLANNCGGMRAQQSGIAVHNVASMRVVLYDGVELEVGWMNDAELDARAALSGREGAVFAQLREFRQRHAALIRTRMPQLPRRVSGYNLDALLPDPDGRFNVARALVGTEGTCVTMLEAELQLVDYYRHRLVIAAGYVDVYRAGDHVPDVLGFNPTAAEGMDRRLYDHVVKKHMPQQKYLDILPRGDGWLLVELGSHDAVELEQRAHELMAKLRDSANPPLEVKLVEARDEQEHLWNVRESGLGATAFVPGKPDTWPGFEDSAVRPEQLGDYLRDLRRLFEKYSYEPSLYGHFGMGCIHCRVDFSLTEAAGVEKYRAFMLEAADLVCGKYNGSLSGEHGDGQARGELLEKMFGAELLGAFEEFKRIWDPDAMMNPGRVVRARPLDADLRLGADYQPWQPETHFKFPDDGGSFAHATLRCVGVGKCRRLSGSSADDDTMCPSFMVTREERHSTRGRTHLLWEMMRGATPIKGGWQDENVKEALDLCLSCKGCKGDCPVNVDVATYKAEFLSHYYEGRLRPRHAYAFGMINRWARFASFAPGLVNLLTQTPGISRLAKLAAGATQARAIPTFAPETFRSWFLRRERQGAPARGEGRIKVVLWPDTFNNYFYPQTAQSAVRVLEHLGFEVAIPDRILCCGRPLYDYGMLEQAKVYLERILISLRPHLAAGTPIVVLEPSCCSVFRDEMPALMPDRAEATKLKEQTLLLSELLAKYPTLALPKLARRAVVQGHCHHKAIMRFDAEKSVLSAMQLELQLLDSGCCGLAGSFGFESDKYEISQACGERALLPKLREQRQDTLILADGFSCRTQIEQGTGRRALHLAEALELALQHGPAGTPPGAPPEAALVTERKRSIQRSMRRAGLVSTLLLGALIGGAVYLRHRRLARTGGHA
jgi:FAD/FMN-containing dehydrogenase/Fe-S oxidoreductase